MASIINPKPGKKKPVQPKKPMANTISNPGAKSTKPKRKIIGGGNVITNPGGKPIKKVIKRLSQQLKKFSVSASPVDTYTQTAARNIRKGGNRGVGRVGKVAR